MRPFPYSASEVLLGFHAIVGIRCFSIFPSSLLPLYPPSELQGSKYRSPQAIREELLVLKDWAGRKPSFQPSYQVRWCLAPARVIDRGSACSQIHYLNMGRYKRSSALITSKAVLITRHFNTQSILAFVNDLVNLLTLTLLCGKSVIWHLQGAGFVQLLLSKIYILQSLSSSV